MFHIKRFKKVCPASKVYFLKNNVVQVNLKIWQHSNPFKIHSNSFINPIIYTYLGYKNIKVLKIFNSFQQSTEILVTIS